MESIESSPPIAPVIVRRRHWRVLAGVFAGFVLASEIATYSLFAHDAAMVTLLERSLAPMRSAGIDIEFVGIGRHTMDSMTRPQRRVVNGRLAELGITVHDLEFSIPPEYRRFDSGVDDARTFVGYRNGGIVNWYVESASPLVMRAFHSTFVDNASARATKGTYVWVLGGWICIHEAEQQRLPEKR